MNILSLAIKARRKLTLWQVFFEARSGRNGLARYFRTRKGLRFYVVKDGPEKNLRLALTSLKQHGVGQLVRIQLTQETITDELQAIQAKEVPPPWREAFERYFWRLR